VPRPDGRSFLNCKKEICKAAIQKNLFDEMDALRRDFVAAKPLYLADRLTGNSSGGPKVYSSGKIFCNPALTSHNCLGQIFVGNAWVKPIIRGNGAACTVWQPHR